MPRTAFNYYIEKLKRRFVQKLDSSDLFRENPLTIVISRARLKLRINLSSIMSGLVPKSTLHYNELMGHDRFGTFYRDTGSDSSIR
jgi:hypothetical protein